MTRPRDPVWLPTATVYTTHDAAGRPHVCPASLRLASDPEFAARVRVRTAERLARVALRGNLARDCCARGLGAVGCG